MMIHLQPWQENWRGISGQKLDTNNRGIIFFYDKIEEDKKDDSKSMFPLVTVWVRHKEPGNYTHLISLPRNCYFNIVSKFEDWGVLHFIF